MRVSLAMQADMPVICACAGRVFESLRATGDNETNGRY